MLTSKEAKQFLDQFEIGSRLGSGAFSEVYHVKKKSGGEEFAMKIIDRQQSAKEEISIETEIEILKKVRHPNIISLFDVLETKDYTYLLMELVTGGELFDRIVDKGHYSEETAVQIVKKILEAVHYLHSMGIAHRDLKPENLLLSDNTEEGRVMISDFGLSKLISEEEVMKTACGTPGYVAPEVLGSVGYGKEVDLWSIGVIAYVLLCGYAPFFGEKDSDLFASIMGAVYEFDSPYWDNISNEAKDFISKLLLVDTKKRMTTSTALKHPWMVQAGDTEGADISKESPSSLHPLFKSQLHRTTSVKQDKEVVKSTIDTAIGIRRSGTSKKDQEEREARSREGRKKAIQEVEELIEIEPSGSLSASFMAKLGIKPKKKDKDDKSKEKEKEKDKDKDKRKSKSKEQTQPQAKESFI